MQKLVTVIILLALFTACSKKGDSYQNKEIASVGDHRLTVADLIRIIPNGTSMDDSTQMADDYIRRWIRNQLMLLKAEENLTSEQKDLKREIEEYRNSLLIFRYQEALLSEKLDTVVTEEEIREYYEMYPGNFVLTQNIVQSVFIQVPLEIADPKKIKELAVSEDDEDVKKLDVYCVQYARKYDHFNNNWVDFQSISSNLPISINNPRNFIRKHKTFEVKDSTDFYFVVLKDFKLKGEKAPMEFVFDRIQSLILNRRKIKFIQDLEQNIYNEGVKERKFKISTGEYQKEKEEKIRQKRIKRMENYSLNS